MHEYLNLTTGGRTPPAAKRSKDTPNVSISKLGEYPQLLRVAAVARLLDCSERHVYELNARGTLPNVPGLGRSLRFRPADVLNLINGEVA
jgi:predicted DNA-binding transcriptional regulator AlpA